MNKVMLMLFILIALASLGYIVFQATNIGRNTIAKESSRITIALRELNNSGFSGVALVVPVENALSITLDVTPTTLGPLSAHLHKGTCEDPGVVLYELSATQGGFSEGEVETSLEELKKFGLLVINAHESETGAGKEVVCGELTL